MPYHFNTPEDTQAMLDSIGADSIDDLFSSIPSTTPTEPIAAYPAGDGRAGTNATPDRD